MDVHPAAPRGLALGVGALDESPPARAPPKIVIAGLGAAVALDVAYRRQRDADLVRFDERFAAATQLGNASRADNYVTNYVLRVMVDRSRTSLYREPIDLRPERNLLHVAARRA